MVLFVAFILLGLILGVGMMLAPALPTAEPRVAASGVLCLSLVMSGALFHAGLFGWNILLVDYLWFALITAVFLGGTLTIGMQRVEEAMAAGEDASFGWPSISTMTTFAAWGLVVLLVMTTIVDAEVLLGGQGGLQVRIDAMQDGANLADINSLTGDIGPGLPAILSYFETQLPIDSAVSLAGWLVALQVVWLWLLHDISLELGATQQQSWAVVLAGLPIGILSLYSPIWMSGLVLSMGFSFFVIRWLRTRLYIDLLSGAVCAAAAILVHPLAIIGLGSAYVVLWGVLRVPMRRWLLGLLVFPLLVLAGISPWLATL